jgi:hypothetical protein
VVVETEDEPMGVLPVGEARREPAIGP